MNIKAYKDCSFAELEAIPLSAVGLGGDFGIEADECFTQPGLDHHVAGRARDLCGGAQVQRALWGSPMDK